MEKKVEQELKENEERLRLVIEAANLGTWDLDLVSDIAIRSFRHDQIWGYTEAQTDWGLEKAMKYVLPEDRNVIMDAYEYGLKTGKISHENRIITPDGRIRWIRAYGRVTYNDSGKPVRVLGIVEDITDRKETEINLTKSKEELKSITNNSPDVIARLDRELRHTFINPYGEKVYGKSKDEIIGKTNEELGMSEKQTIELNTYFNKVFITGEQQTAEFDFISPTFGHQYFLSYLVPEKNYKGEVNSILAITRDISHLKRSEQKLKELNSLKNKLFSIISHDLKSPFTSILGFSELLINKIRQKDYKAIDEFANTINTSAIQAVDLLKNLIDWSSWQTNRTMFMPTKLNYSTLIHQVISHLNVSALHKNVNISIKVPDDLYINADKEMISTVLRNLVSNAIKYTNSNGNIVISAIIKEFEIETEVCDTGMGIAIETIEELFKSEVPITKPGTNNETGTGLGLVLCKEFIERHKGKIWVKSNPGEGSKFFFSLPLSH